MRLNPIAACIACTLLFVVEAAGRQIGQILTDLDSRIHASGWIDNYTAKGVLHDHGIAIWEMPSTYQGSGGTTDVVGGGYDHAIRRLALNPALYQALLTALGAAYLYDAQDMVTVRDTYFKQPYSEMNVNDFNGVYDAGTSVAFQNLVFAPVEGAGAYTYHPYPELAGLLQIAAGRQLHTYGNIGFQNNAQFYQNEWAFNVLYGEQEKNPNGNWGFLVNPVPGIPVEVALDQKEPDDQVAAMRFFMGQPYHPRFVGARPDFTLPDALFAGLASVAHMASQFGPAMKFYIGGEYGVGSPGANPGDPPRTNYSPHAMNGFRNWLQKKYVTIGPLNAAWGTSLSGFGAVQASHVVVAIPAAVVDFEEYQHLLKEELDLAQYKVAKFTRPDGSYAMLTFGTTDMEVGWQTSDFGATGNWYGDAATYFQPLGQALSYINGAAALSGAPTSIAISSPPTGTGCVFTAPPPPLAFSRRCLTLDHFRLFLHDVFSAGSFHLGYYKAPGIYSTYSSSSATDMIQFLHDLKAKQGDLLRFMTPYHRVTAHLDAARMGQIKTDPVAGAVVSIFEEKQVPFALASNRRCLTRLFSRQGATRGVLLAPFRSDLLDNGASLFGDYIALAGDTNPSPTVGVLIDLATYNALSASGALTPFVPAGTIGNSILFKHATLPLFVAVFATSAPSKTDLDPVIEAFLLSTPQTPARPIVVLAPGANSGDVHANVVSDGLNYYVALANRSTTQSYTNVTLGVHPQILQKVAPRVTGFTPDVSGPYTLAPKETKLIYLAANVSGSYTTNDLSTELAALQEGLSALQADGFDVDAGLELISFASQVNATTHPERVLAGITRLHRMLFLRATRTGSAGTVDAVRWNGAPVVGAAVQLLRIVDAHEEQNVGTTDAVGHAAFTINLAVGERWDFGTQTFQVPSQSIAQDPIEIHVHDRATGSQAFVRR